MKAIIEKIKKNGLITNSIYGIGSKMVAMLLYMIADILIVRYLTYQLYGEWTYYYAIAAILFVVGRLGINSATQVFVAGSKTAEEKKGYIGVGLAVRFVISMAVGLFLLILMPNIAVFMGYPEKYAELRSMFFWLPLLIFGNSVVDFFKCLYVGTVEFQKVFWLTVLEYLGILLCGVGAIAVTGSIQGLNIGYVVSYFLVSVSGYRMLKPEWKHLEFRKVYADREKIQKLVRYAVAAFFAGLISILLMDMDTFMLGLLSEPGESGVYSIGKSLLTKATNLSVAVASSTMTAFALVTKENVESKQKLFRRLNQWNLLAIGCVCAGCLILGRFLIVLLYGAEYTVSVRVMYTLLPYYALFSMSVFPATYLNYQYLALKCLSYNAIMFFCNLILNLLLIPKYGAMGAAVATDISIVPYTLLLYLATNKNFREKRRDTEA